MTNDVVGGQPFALAYCTLCGSGILYDTRRADGQDPYKFGSSGLLYRSNKLMYDIDTNSLWNQFTRPPRRWRPGRRGNRVAHPACHPDNVGRMEPAAS